MRESLNVLRMAQRQLVYAREQLQEAARMLVSGERRGRRMNVSQMRSLELAGVRHRDIAQQAGISDRQVRSLLSQVRTRPSGRPIGALDSYPRKPR